MQDKRKETERPNEQLGSMDAYNNRKDNRPGRVEETRESESEEAITQDSNKQPGITATPEEE